MNHRFPDLPVREVLGQLDAALAAGHALLDAPPGSGKTTLAPLALRDAPWLDGRRILMLEPRRVAARAAARRMASLIGEEIGGTVGFSTRFERRVSARTSIEVVTEGILTRRLQQDPLLDGVGLLIFDEFHERSLHADLALALSLDVASALREDLRILVMSATLDRRALHALLPDARVVQCSGRAFPVEIEYARRRATRPLARRVVDAVSRTRARARADVLVFLPGVAEIRRVEALLRDAHADLPVVPLYGELTGAAQDRALLPDTQGRQRVVLATDIAETSLTIEGIDTVIDSGLCKRPRFDPNSGMSRLETLPVSRASAAQRAGRAGRLGPGHCLRLWTEAEHSTRPAFLGAEILSADLAPLALELLQWGVADPEALCWIDAPPSGAWRQALDLLRRLGALDDGGRLNRRGQRMAELPLHPRLARLVLEASDRGDAALGASIAALLSERDGVARDRGADIEMRLQALARDEGDRRAAERVRRVARQVERLVAKDRASSGPPPTPGELIALAYPDRIARRHARNRYRLANGRIASLDEADPLIGADWLAIAELDAGGREGRVQCAAALDPGRLPALFPGCLVEHEQLRWNERDERFETLRETRLDALVLASAPAEAPSEQALASAWHGLIRRHGLAWLGLPDAAMEWARRVSSLHHWLPEEDWPLLDEASMLARLDDWLTPWLGGARTRKSLRGLDFSMMLTSLLDWEQGQALERLAPATLRVPSGSRKRLRYPGDGSPPWLEVCVQELFGLENTPRVCDGRVAVVIHLLSPAQRPVQVTQDLAGFWDNTYAEVRKDLRGRYPKHAWPEDPRVAPPTRRVRPRRTRR